ncbi:AbrB family transcriptional regulator [Mesorhizobium sp. CAU 1741]|uniref:AbrB family transcriptional regulator n=1 Tax=Mesorhizobium sp. CAU 1741 TaxID=3140366 RepID=UPI00325C306D
MDTSPDPQLPPQFLTSKPPAIQWSGVLVGSALLFLLLDLAHLPAAALIGPMIAGVVAGTNGASVRVPRWLFGAAQAVLGILIARSLELEIFRVIVEDWPLFLGGVLSTVAASSYLGWQISRWGILPGSTAIWGSAPGAASAMVLMADAFGADFRLVAFMQYLRVMIVALFAALVAAFLVDAPAVAQPTIVLFPPLEWPGFPITIATGLVGAVAGWLLRLPTPFFLGSMILGGLLHMAGGVAFQLPQWLLMIAYALIGWSIGLNFTRQILLHAARALPQVIGSILLLVMICAGIGLVLSELLEIDYVTAYLATSPGGMDAVAIIAAASGNANMSLIMAMQMARFLFVLLFGPLIARLLSKSSPD